MRWISLLALMGCAELPPLPAVDAGAHWSCDDGFDAAIAECDVNECPGFMAMNSLVDAENVHYVSDTVSAVVKYTDTNSVETVELHSTTDYFRSIVSIGSIGLQPGETVRSYRVLERELADIEIDAVSLDWEASNSEIPQTNVGVRGLSRIELMDDWVRVTFLVNDQDDQFLQGCAYMPVD